MSSIGYHFFRYVSFTGFVNEAVSFSEIAGGIDTVGPGILYLGFEANRGKWPKTFERFCPFFIARCLKLSAACMQPPNQKLL